MCRRGERAEVRGRYFKPRWQVKTTRTIFGQFFFFCKEFRWHHNSTSNAAKSPLGAMPCSTFTNCQPGPVGHLCAIARRFSGDSIFPAAFAEPQFFAMQAEIVMLQT
jgi:hypothetical protein